MLLCGRDADMSICLCYITYYTYYFGTVYTLIMRTYFRIFVLVLFLFLLFVSVFMTYENVLYTLRSRATFGAVSSSNSLAVSTPTCVLADGESRSRIYVYCNNARGFGEPHIQVSISPLGDAHYMELIPIQGITDDIGKAIFDVTSRKEGMFDLQIDCGDTIITSTHQACFTR